MTGVACAHCRTANPAAARFCMGCGASLAAPPAPSTLRFVTVAFCDISGSTRLARGLDPQVWHDVLAAYFADVGGALAAAGGRLEKFIGDAVVGVFGADTAGEDDARRAARGALAALRALGERNDRAFRRYGLRLSIRFGLASGRVVLTDRDSSFAIGSVMNRAARLQAAAPPDGAVVDVRTWLLVRDDLHCTPVAPVPAKGFDRPLRAWRVTAEPLRAAPGPVFVNQSQLLAGLRSAVMEGPRRATLTTIGLEGDMGSGKTRVLRQLAGQLRDEPVRVVLTGCQAADEEQALWRLHDLERQVAGGGGPDRGPAAGWRAGPPAGGEVGPAPPGVAPSIEEMQWRLRCRLAQASRERPLVLLVDDYPRAPAALRAVLTGPPPADTGPLVVVRAGRRLARDDGGGPVFRVPALSDRDAADLVGALRGDLELHTAAADAVRAGTAIVRGGRGNPLFLEQLVALAGEDGDSELPPSAEAALGARIARLSEPARYVLACLGAWGRDLGRGDLDAICELDEAALAAGLDELAAQDLWGNQLAGEVAYAHLVLRERARVHGAIARRVRAFARTAPSLLDLAAAHAARAHAHWRQLDPGSRGEAAAAQCLVGAARQAIARSDVRRAADLAGRARALHLPDPALALEVAALESYALGASGRVAEALARIDAVADPDANRSAAAHLRVNELALRGGAHRHADALARAGDDPGAAARLAAWEGLDAARGGDYPRAEQLLRTAYGRLRHAAAGLGVPEIYGNLSLFLAYGDTPVPQATAECLALRAEVAGAPILHAVVSCAAALLVHLGGATDRAGRMLAEARTVFAETGHVLAEAGAGELAAGVAELAGQPDRARDLVSAAQRLYEEAGAESQAADCALRVFVLSRTAGAARVAPPPPEGPPAAGWAGQVLRHQARALAAPDRRAALAHLDRAVAAASAVRGAGARLVPLTGCRRIAVLLADEARVAALSAALAELRRVRGLD